MRGCAMQVKAVLTCQDCKREYVRWVQSPDDQQDLREGVKDGRCDFCFEARMEAYGAC
jgi:predicted adenine nucleotide alpha hydrolase (AANH) superfamily ATPase